jgi:Uma2 family endonuclease
MSPLERASVVDQLPSEIELGPPEGDLHRVPKQRGLDALDAFFKRMGRRVYLSSELPVYYPGERMFAPDLIAVVDVDPHERMRWVVADEARGLDLALEVTLEGSRNKDLVHNVARFAALGIPEYFVFDRRAQRLHGWRLEPGRRDYQPILPQEGRWPSRVLGLELAVEGERFRFYTGTALVPETAELLQRANLIAEQLQQRMGDLEGLLVAETERRERAEADRQRAEADKQRAEARVLELEAELERLRSKG